MDFYVSRAMQIAGMTSVEIGDLHTKEREKGYAFQNCDVQRLFRLPTIKDRFLIPDEGPGQEAHAARIRSELIQQKVAQWVTLKKQDEHGQMTKTEDVPPWEILTCGNLEYLHLFDTRVFDAVLEEKMSFVYAGGAAKSGGRLRDRVA